jgi:hypothetical protein
VDASALSIVRQVSIGRRHSCALRDDGRVLCWGANTSGELGTNTNVGTNIPTSNPQLVDASALGTVRHLAVGGNHSCALRDDGRVLCWGSNFFGQIGTDTNLGSVDAENPTPALVEGLPTIALPLARRNRCGSERSAAAEEPDFGFHHDATESASRRIQHNVPKVDETDLLTPQHIKAVHLKNTLTLNFRDLSLPWGAYRN